MKNKTRNIYIMKLKDKYFKLLLLLILLFVSPVVSAQQDLQINRIFEVYGKQKGAVMVVLSGKSAELKRYKLDKYRSLTINYDKEIFENIQTSLEADKEGAYKIKEVVNNGVVSSGYYQLRNETEKTNRYILFKVDRNHRATLIYMEGGMDSEELIEKLFLKQNK